MTILKSNKKPFIIKDKQVVKDIIQQKTSDFKHPKSNEKFEQVNIDKLEKVQDVLCDSKLHWTNKFPRIYILKESDDNSVDNLFEEVSIVLITEDLSK